MADKTSREFLTDASKTYATVIFDAPQPQDFDEVLTLVDMMDGIVLIVTEGKTQRDEIEQFKTLLTQINSNLFGVIIKER
jgi:Mrp family chromosome partitioning ATPase